MSDIRIGIYSRDDQTDMLALLKNESIKKTYMIPDFASEEQACAMFEKLLRFSAMPEHYERGIFCGNRLIGFINDVEINGGQIELGYVVHPDYQNKGYATTALKAAMDELFESGFNEIITGAFDYNIASRRVMEKCGMTLTDKTELIEYRGRSNNCVFYSRKRPNRKNEDCKMNYTDVNASAIDKWIKDGWEWGIPISHETYIKAQDGEWNVVLTPVKPVPHEWFAPFLKDGRMDGTALLGLASGGGQQMPIFSALGAECTVLDYSQCQLDSERIVSEREGYSINIVRGDMTKPLPFADNSFDIIFHPVSNCYIEDVYHVWNECFRVLKPGGILLAGMDNGFNFLIDDDTARPMIITNTLPFNPLKNPEQMKKLQESDNGIQFSHTFDEQIGGQLKAGFVITAAFEDYNSEPGTEGIPTFWVTRALKQ